MDDQRTTEDLRRTLFDTIEMVMEKEITHGEALVISKLADNIIKTADLELKHVKTLSDLDKGETGLNPGPLMLTNRKS